MYRKNEKKAHEIRYEQQMFVAKVSCKQNGSLIIQGCTVCIKCYRAKEKLTKILALVYHCCTK
jgi:hypothetical protein